MPIGLLLAAIGLPVQWPRWTDPREGRQSLHATRPMVPRLLPIQGLSLLVFHLETAFSNLYRAQSLLLDHAVMLRHGQFVDGLTALLGQVQQVEVVLP